MPAVLLPRTAAPFAPRAPPSVVLDTAVNPWLTQTLKRINRVKRPLNSVPQHLKCLTEILSTDTAIWNLCSIVVPKAPEGQLQEYDHPVVDALFRFQFLHVQAYVVSIDMVQSHEIAFKLTKDTISKLVEYHKDIYMVDQAAGTWHWTEKEVAIKKQHEDFIQAVNKYVYRTDKMALEGIEDDGSGELLCGQSEEVKGALENLFCPLLPPPPRIIAPPSPTMPSTPIDLNWWAPTLPLNSSMAPVESWKVLPSNNPATSSISSINMPSVTAPSMWNGTDIHGSPLSVASSTSSMAGTSAGFTDSLAATSNDWWNTQSMPISQPQYQQLPWLPTSNSYIPQLPLPISYAQPCSNALGYGGFGGWETGRYVDFAGAF